MPALLLRPIVRFVSSLCCITPTRQEIGVGTLPLTAPTENIVVFPKHTPSHAKPFSNRCKQCGSDQFVIRVESRICTYCGESNYYEAEQSAGRATSLREFNFNATKRLAHFKNWLARLQGKEECRITMAELESLRVCETYPDTMSEYDRIKLAMRNQGLQKYYNHIYYVMRHIFGYSLVEFRKIHEARLVAMFMRIQEPFARSRTKRTNMLSYQFLIKKFCELLGYNVAYYIPVLKSRTSLQNQDHTWKQICDSLGLPFYPSV
jgi:ribosomal protein L37E